LGLQERPPGLADSPGRGVDARVFENLPHRRRRDLVPQSCQLTVDAPVTPARVVPRHLQHQRPYRSRSPRSPGRAAGIGPAPSDQTGMPAQQGLRGNDEPQLAEMAAGKQPGQGGQYRSIGPGQPRVLDLTLEHRDLVTQDQDLHVPGAIGTGEQGEPAEDPENCEVGES
jgi:hypothetical protein